jgi:hypothetical protein
MLTYQTILTYIIWRCNLHFNAKPPQYRYIRHRPVSAQANHWHSPTSMARREHHLCASGVRWWVRTVRFCEWKGCIIFQCFNISMHPLSVYIDILYKRCWESTPDWVVLHSLFWFDSCFAPHTTHTRSGDFKHNSSNSRHVYVFELFFNIIVTTSRALLAKLKYKSQPLLMKCCW